MLAIPPAGLAAGLGLWLAFGGAQVQARAEELDGRMTAIQPVRPTSAQVGGASAAARPFFALTTGPGAVTEPTLRLDGVSRSPRRVAALVSVNGAPVQWVERGGSIDQVTLEEVSSSRAIFDTPLGSRLVKLGETSGPSAPAASADAAAPQEMPRGFRAPPEPASAPAMGG